MTPAFTIDDLLRLPRAGRPVLSPDGRIAVFPVVVPDAEADRNRTDLYRLDPASRECVRLTHGGSTNADPAFSPDGARLAFTSNRGGTSQIWVLPLDGGEARQVTRFRTGATRPVWFPDGRRLLVVSPVYRDTGDPAEIARREDARAKSGPGPRIIDALLFRHWDHWTEGRIDHVFSVDVETGEALDLTPGPHPAPAPALGGDPDYAVSPDGSEVCFVSVREEGLAWSTNLNLWTVPSAGGEPRRVSPWDGVCNHPVYSPDGRFIAYTAMRRPGYEADRLELLLHERATGATREVAPGFDRSVGAPVWSPDGSWLAFAAQDRGQTRIYRVPAAGGDPRPLTSGATDGRPAITPTGDALLFTRQTLVASPELFRVGADGGDATRLTTLGSVERFDLAEGEEFWFEGAAGARVHGILVRPRGFREGARYPVVFLIHGGPQTMFGHDFHERWNPQLFAARGWVTVMINPRGSTGYGQEFTDAIRGEWGGNCYRDLMLGFDHVLAAYPFCDPGRTAAAGASFGGFMVNWIAGHTDRFRCLVSHDGIFNTEMMDYATDELWFTEWEFGGLPWEAQEEYRKYSPHLHVGAMKTPMLVVQGEQDFRCVTLESLGLFTALQRKGVPSRLLYFPDEGHWVLKPRNRKVWWDTVLDWIERHI